MWHQGSWIIKWIVQICLEQDAREVVGSVAPAIAFPHTPKLSELWIPNYT